jgi:hypothetical protein
MNKANYHHELTLKKVLVVYVVSQKISLKI